MPIPHLSRLLVVVATLLCVACPLASAQATRSVDLASHPETNREFRYRIRSETQQNMKSPLGENGFKAAQDLTVHFKFVESDKSGSIVELTHEHMKIDLKGLTFDGSWDSDQPEADDADNRLGRIARPLINIPVRVHLDANGEITRIADLETLAPEGLDGALFRQLFSEDAFKAMYHMLFRIKEPPTKTRRGEQWRLIDDGASGLVRVSREYHLTLERNTADRAHIRIKGVAGSEVEGAAAGLKPTKYELEGSCEWNTELGIMEELETTEHVVFDTGNKELEMTLEGRSSTTLERLR